MVMIVALLIHLRATGLQTSVFPTVALALWGLNACLRIARIAYYNLGGFRDRQTSQATIKPFFDFGLETVSAVRMTVTLRRPLEIRPGQYLYLFLSDMGSRGRFQAHPYVITWWNDSFNATELSFLIQPQRGLSEALISRNAVRSVIVDGPYGKDLCLEKYETVILAAKGIGIAGILPYIRHMTYRKVSKDKEYEAYRRGLITRKIDVFWVLEDNCQEDWISEWIVNLREKDSEKVNE